MRAHQESKGENKDKEQLKKRRKIRLDMHKEQVFVDAPDSYVRIYDPIPIYYWIIGFALVLGAIGVCMFPLWSPSVRKGAYYLSVAAVGFLVLIIVLTTLRLVVFCILWALSMIWLLYQYEYKGDGTKKPEKSKKKKKKDKVLGDKGDAELDPLVTLAETKEKKKPLVDGKYSPGESDWGEKGDSQNEETPGGKDSGESESEGSQRSSTGIRPAMNHKFILTLVIGISIGFSLAIILLLFSEYSLRNCWFGKSDIYCQYDSRGLLHLNHDQDKVETAFQFGANKHDKAFHMLKDSAVADAMARKVRVLCWVMTAPANHENKAMHVKKTWGTRCNILLFMSSVADEKLPSIALPVKEGHEYLWGKTKAAFKYIYEHYRDEADWFMKADDDTYVVVENLRYMLSAHSPQDPVYFGCHFKPYVKQGYMSGGAGYVLSRTALHRLVEVALPSSKHCLQGDEGMEDVEIGNCLFNVGVKAGDSRDPLGRGRFFPYDPEQHLIPGMMDKNHWYWEYIYYKAEEGSDGCSDNAVSFHYVSPNMMYVMDYLIYHLKPFGINYKMQISGDEPNTGLVLKGVHSVAVSEGAAKRGAQAANLICCVSLTALVLTVLVLLTLLVLSGSYQI